MKTFFYQPLEGTTPASTEGIMFISQARETSIDLFQEFYGYSRDLAEALYVEKWLEHKAKHGPDVWALDFAYDEDMNEAVAKVWVGIDESVLSLPDVYFYEEDA